MMGRIAGIRRALSLVLWLLGGLGLTSASPAQDVSTSFEFNDLNGFTLGISPDTVTFENGEAKSISVFSLYHSGIRSWMIDGGDTGIISFETPAVEVNLFLRDRFANVDSVLTAYDLAGGVITSVDGTNTGWREVNLSGPVLVDRIEFANTGGGNSQYAVIDDFDFTAVDISTVFDPIPEPIPMGSIQVSLRALATGLTSPNWGTHAGDGSGRLFVTDQTGILWAIDTQTGAKTSFLDLSDRIVSLATFFPDERGLLGVALHPDYASNGLLYVYTSEPEDGAADFPLAITPNHQSVVTEWQVSLPADPASLPTAEREILRIDEPQLNHNGGGLAFGPLGALFISLGDGGNRDDDGAGHSPEGNAQDPTNVLGTLLRIDPDGSNSANGQYGIPQDNPGLAIPEIYAYGLRNVFRFSFDSLTGELYLGDVGQGDLEEIDIGISGANYGWPRKEGSFFFERNGGSNGFITDFDPGVSLGFDDPIAEYDHDEGVAVIGGFVYRGSAVPELIGKYLFGDFNGRLFYFDPAPDPIASASALDGGSERNSVSLHGSIFELDVIDPPVSFGSLLGFGEDEDGELYVLANDDGIPEGTNGVVLRLPEPTAPILHVAALASIGLLALGRSPRGRLAECRNRCTLGGVAT